MRLLTIVGAGGMGKTRLALAVGEASYELRVTNYEGIRQGKPPRVCNSEFVTSIPRRCLFCFAGGIDDGGGGGAGDQCRLGGEFALQPQQALLQALRTKQILLILDNFEHLLEATALVVDLLQAAPGVHSGDFARTTACAGGSISIAFPHSSMPKPVPSDSAVVDVYRLA